MPRQAYISLMGLYQFDNTLFDDVILPDGLEKDVLINNILLNLAELEVIYPDVNFMKFAIKNWSASEYYVWDKMYNTTKLDYNPIWNKDGTITEVENTKGSTDGTNTEKVTGFNEDAFRNANQNITDVDNTFSRDYTRKEQGNIGITTTQQMIKEEREVSQFNIYEFIVESFKNRFCLLIY